MAVSVLPKGTSFVRTVAALATSGGNFGAAADHASRWRDTPEVAAHLKAAIAGGSIGGLTWGDELAQYGSIAGEFLSLVGAATIIGRLAGLRRVPFNTPVPRELAGPQGFWVGERAPGPITSMQFDTLTLGQRKAVSILVVSRDLLKLAILGTEAMLRAALIRGIGGFLDEQFLGPNVTATDDRPASITNGAAVIASSGSTVAAITADMAALVEALVSADIALASPVFILRPATAAALAFMRNTDGSIAFPGVTVFGGTLAGIPVITSTAAPAGTVVLLDASEIVLADEGAIRVDASENVALEMSDTPNTAGSSTMVSMYQSNSVALKVVRTIDWQRGRNGAVAVLTGLVIP